jgi:hypothetical protein
LYRASEPQRQLGNNSGDGSLFNDSCARSRRVPENLACLEIDQISRAPDINGKTRSSVNLFEVLDCTGDNAFRCRMSIEETDRLEHSGRLQIAEYFRGGGPVRVDGPTIIGLESKPLS